MNRLSLLLLLLLRLLLLLPLGQFCSRCACAFFPFRSWSFRGPWRWLGGFSWSPSPAVAPRPRFVRVVFRAPAFFFSAGSARLLRPRAKEPDVGARPLPRVPFFLFGGFHPPSHPPKLPCRLCGDSFGSTFTHAVSVVIVATKLVVCGVFLLLTPLLQPGVLGEHSIPAVIGLLNVILLAQQRRGVSLARFFFVNAPTSQLKGTRGICKLMLRERCTMQHRSRRRLPYPFQVLFVFTLASVLFWNSAGMLYVCPPGTKETKE